MTAKLEYEGELMIGEVLTGISFGATGYRGVATFGRNYRQRDGKRSAAPGKFFTDRSLYGRLCRFCQVRIAGASSCYPAASAFHTGRRDSSGPLVYVVKQRSQVYTCRQATGRGLAQPAVAG